MEWITKADTIERFDAMDLQGNYQLTRVDKQGVPIHDALHGLVTPKLIKELGWLEIDTPTIHKPYAPAKERCFHDGCARESVFMFLPSVPGPEDGRTYRCAKHAASGLSCPEWADECAHWEVEALK